jgi:hypothetical protein
MLELLDADAPLRDTGNALCRVSRIAAGVSRIEGDKRGRLP